MLDVTVYHVCYLLVALGDDIYALSILLTNFNGLFQYIMTVVDKLKGQGGKEGERGKGREGQRGKGREGERSIEFKLITEWAKKFQTMMRRADLTHVDKRCM